jgi:hypothetical protein
MVKLFLYLTKHHAVKDRSQVWHWGGCMVSPASFHSTSCSAVINYPIIEAI